MTALATYPTEEAALARAALLVRTRGICTGVRRNPDGRWELLHDPEGDIR